MTSNCNSEDITEHAYAIGNRWYLWLRYCTDVAQRRSTKLCTIFNRLLGWYTIYIFGGSYPLTEFYQVQNSLCVQVLHSPILATLLHGTRAVGVSSKLCGVQQRAPPIFGMAAITLGIGPHSGSFFFSSSNLCGRRLDDYHILPHMLWSSCEFRMQV